MTPTSLYAFAKDFAAPLATVIAAGVAAYVTYAFQKRQTDIAANTLRLELFHRRFEIYQQATQLYDYIAENYTKPYREIDHERIAAHHRSFSEARFILTNTTHAFLDRFREASDDLLSHSKGPRPGNGDEEASFNEQVTRKKGRLSDLRERLPYEFERELTIRAPAPSDYSPSRRQSGEPAL